MLLGWAAVGALVAFGLAAAFTPFLLLVVPAAGLALLLGLRTGLGRSTWAALGGAAWVPLWLAWSDRRGPGAVCTGSVESSSCSTVGSPWPWLVIGLALLAVGLGVAIRRPAADVDAPERGRAAL